jgi:hypothetical protein
VKDFVIIGSGFSALISYYFLKKFNIQIISSNNINNNLNNFKSRKNLNINKLFSTKSQSRGDFIYYKNNSFKIHDRLSFGGNTNLWGGFIDIQELSDKTLSYFKEDRIKLEKLNLNTNGYKSNIDTIRQLRDSKNRILDSSKFINNILPGYVHSIQINKGRISIKFFNYTKNQYDFLDTKKLIIAVSFPQLIDLLIRSELINKAKFLTLEDYVHQFKLSFSEHLNIYNNSDFIVKYDLFRALKHYLGYQESIDRFLIKIPMYINQTFYNKKIVGKLKIDYKNKKIIEVDNLNSFGDSIHYCNLKIDNLGINEYISNISKNIIGVSMPFVKQSKPRPISNDIINNFSKKIL